MKPLQILKLIIPTIAFYAISIAIIEYCGAVSPGGPCVPSGAIIPFFIFIPVVIILLLRNIILAIRDDKKHWIVAFTHVVILTSCFIFL